MTQSSMHISKTMGAGLLVGIAVALAFKNAVEYASDGGDGCLVMIALWVMSAIYNARLAFSDHRE